MKGWPVAILLVLTLLPEVALAQMYRWVDEQGTVHFTNELNSVPERYRLQIQEIPFIKTSPAPARREPSAPSRGITKIPFKPGSPILVSAKINGKGPVTLMLDTGADRTTVAPLPLWKLGISTSGAPREEVRGVTGTKRIDVVRVDSVEVGGAKVGPLFIWAHDSEFKNADGLLGRDFLDNFRVTIDSKELVVTLTSR